MEPRHVQTVIDMMPEYIEDFHAEWGVYPNPSFILRKAREGAWRAEGWGRRRGRAAAAAKKRAGETGATGPQKKAKGK